MKHRLLLTVFSLLTPISAFAWQPTSDDVNTLIDSDVRKEIKEILQNELVIKSIQNANEKYKDLTKEGLDELDGLWRSQTKSEDQYFIAAVLSNPVSAYLTRVQAHSKGLYGEIFIMNDKGVNVGQSTITSDYWQGDEMKWQATFLLGYGAVFIDEPEKNEATNTWVVQYNVAISDESEEAIGAATFEISLDELAKRKGVYNDVQ